MEDFQQIARLGAIQVDRWRDRQQAGAETPAPALPLRRILLTLTVVLLGMITWWGH